ncbi:hypothetical protein [Micromonospora sp. NPDC005413]|uniref:hypothetical protein n=1 Tax=Micromonospora sp. NPDC005413 TaxID=3154563 RepID=UPI0033A5D875
MLRSRRSRWLAVLRTVVAAAALVAAGGLTGRSVAAEPPAPAAPDSHTGGETPARDLPRCHPAGGGAPT